MKVLVLLSDLDMAGLCNQFQIPHICPTVHCCLLNSQEYNNVLVHLPDEDVVT